jgi:hypothetical protein
MDMSEPEDRSEAHERIDVKGALGMSRRDLIRRGAVVGTLVWAVPVISSVNQKAFAESAPGSHTASGDIHYTVPTADPTLVRHVNFSFDDNNSGFLDYDDTNGVSYHVDFSSTLIQVNTGYACGVISGSGGLGLDGQFLHVKVADNGPGPTDLISGDVFASCPAITTSPSTTGVITSGDIVVT